MDKELNPIDKKCRNDKWVVTIVSNDNLICRNCIYRNDEKPCVCKMYQGIKPDMVFEKGECKEYIRV